MNDMSNHPAESLGDYVARARAWLEAMEPRFGHQARKGLSIEEDLALGREYQRLKSEAGYASITLPRELGGGGGTEIQKILFGQEEFKHDFPVHYYTVSLGMPIPMLLRYEIGRAHV
jgi:alkylation response protein AidB-like acyl-CoA dehydrogenase